MKPIGLLIVLFLLVQPSPCVRAAEPVRLGVDVPLTGAAADIGHFLLWGVEIALDEANAEDPARPVAAVVKDDETNPGQAAANVRDFLGPDKVAAVLGPANSGNALAMIPLMQEANKPLMLLTASATKLTGIYADSPENYVFRATLPDHEQIRTLLDWAVKHFTTIAIACDTTPYGQLAREDMTELMAEKGMTPAAVVQFDAGELDLSAQVRTLAESKAQAVAVLSLPPEVAGLVRAADAAGYRPRFIGQYPFFLQPIKELPDRLSNGLTGVLGSSPDASPKAREIDRIVREKYGFTGYYPFKFVEAGYEGTKIMIQAVRAAGSTDGPAILRALQNLDRFQGVARVFDRPFSKERHELYRAQDLYMGVWENGAVKRLDQ